MGPTPTPSVPLAKKLPTRSRAPSLLSEELLDLRPYKGLRHGPLFTKHAQVAALLAGKKADEIPDKAKKTLKALEDEITERLELSIPQEAP